MPDFYSQNKGHIKSTIFDFVDTSDLNADNYIKNKAEKISLLSEIDVANICCPINI